MQRRRRQSRTAWLAAASAIVAAAIAAGCATPEQTTPPRSNTPGHTPPIADVHHTTPTSSMVTPTGWHASPDAYARTHIVTLNRHVEVPVLMYHAVSYLPGNSLGMAPGQFAAEMQWLHDHGFHPINLGQLYAAFYRGYTLPPRPVVLTFDDGYESVYTSAFPVLERYHFPATIFMISGAVGHHGRLQMLSWSELAQMEASALIDVESHTVHHLDLASAPPSTVQTELVDSAQTLSAHLHHPVLYFCYPSGRFNATVEADLKADGYLLAFTELPGYAQATQGPYALHRIRVWEGESLAGFAAALAPSLGRSVGPGSSST
ncbi:MAG: polysaccharide deacetylase family protein [Thermoflavifilum sp.]|nr:polysaccharide deacetylase family protein [Thermoflavifilum sp.]MCL6513231.1 polysaccharide deacetylase family protein [Alicyclobacillus sp.]